MLVIRGTETQASRVGRVFRSPRELASVAFMTALAALGGAVAGCEPSGVSWANPIITAAFAAAVVLLGAFAGWRWLLAAATVALLATRTWAGVAAGLVAFGLVGYASTRRRPPRSLRAGSAALTVQVVLRLPGGWAFGVTAAVAA